MPVVMTGAPGGALGGSSGAMFGSGLAGISGTPKKMFTPNLEVWAKRGEEDREMIAIRSNEYKGLRDARLAMVAEQKRQDDKLKKSSKASFSARQKERLSAEAAEKERLKQFRLQALAQNKVDSQMDMREGEPGYGPKRWLWPTAHKHPRHFASSASDVSVAGGLLGPGVLTGTVAEDSSEASPKSPPGGSPPGASQLLELTTKLPGYLDEMEERKPSEHPPILI